MYNQIRQTFIDYFIQKGHKHITSSSTIPHGDKSLLFTNSGMVQFKNVFTGAEKVDYKTATTCQKSVRAGGKHNDLDNVGYTNRHHTFFEMLGNFSFGDYFKEDAIKYAWDLLTNVYKIDKSKLYVTVYYTDFEAIEIWKKIANLPEERIVKIATNDNFWSMGDTGPCGPCSEIFYDLGEEATKNVRGGNFKGSVGESDRYVEIWNLVFMQYEKFANSDELKPLPKPSIDTGASVERLAMILEGKFDTYDTSLFQEIIDYIAKIYGIEKEFENSVPHRVIADHVRCATFLISDGVLPDKVGRGYALRKILRRAIRFAYKLNKNKTCLSEIIEIVVQLMQDAYPEILKDKNRIKNIIHNEEILFRKTLEDGMLILSNELLKNNKTISGDIVFKLYDTYGFPVDLTENIAQEHNLMIDVEGFEKCMEVQKEKSRINWQTDEKYKQFPIWTKLIEQGITTEEFFYKTSTTECEAKVLAIINENGNSIDQTAEGENCFIIIDKTVFYPLGGGQVGDCGVINGNYVFETVKLNGLILHKLTNIKNQIAINNNVKCVSFRKNVAQNHTATHLLQAALRKVLGEHVQQRGSYVDEECLRFDFTHHSSLTEEEKVKILNLINQWISQNLNVEVKYLQKDEALKSGAIAFFDEKYGDIVRVVSIEGVAGAVSVEFCGGIHVRNTGEIFTFEIESESSIGSGIRRIIARTGAMGKQYLINSLQKQEEINNLKEQLKQKDKEIATLPEKIVYAIDKQNNVTEKFAITSFIDINIEVAKNISAIFATKMNKIGIVFIHSNEKQSTTLVVYKPKTVQNEVNCKTLLDEVMKITNGKGGGNPSFGQCVFEIKSDLKQKVENLIKNF
jgi:alanyl-tRNA synthetase